MAKHTMNERLSGLLRKSYSNTKNEVLHPHQENRIFTNRNIKLSRIQAVGLDMDFTLAQYNQAALDRLTMEKVLPILVEKHGYPCGILKIPYEEAFAIRGLMVDTELGNVLKMDKFRYVSLAFHGLKPIDSRQKTKIYNTIRIHYNTGRFRSIDTLFELLEAYLYAAIIDHIECKEKKDLDYKQLFKDLRGAIDLCHKDDSLKNEIKAHPEKFIQDDPLLVTSLHQFKESGKRLFVVTNSEVGYTDFVLSFLFRNAQPFFKGWRSCFDIVCAFSRKPGFFMENRPPEIIEDKEHLFFSGGNINYLEDRLRIKGDKVLYVGDHIYGDILKSKHNSTWRTCIIVPELDYQIRAEQRAKPFLKELIKNESRHKQITMELHWRRGQSQDLQQFKEAEADELNPRDLARIDGRIASLNRKLEANHRELSTLMCESTRLRRQISNLFNPFWGRLFKTGGQLSIFAEQIRDYACIYTSSVSNFNFYGSQSYLESLVTPMPHERTLLSLGDLNFDVSLEEEKQANGAAVEKSESEIMQAPTGASLREGETALVK